MIFQISQIVLWEQERRSSESLIIFRVQCENSKQEKRKLIIKWCWNLVQIQGDIIFEISPIIPIIISSQQNICCVENCSECVRVIGFVMESLRWSSHDDQMVPEKGLHSSTWTALLSHEIAEMSTYVILPPNLMDKFELSQAMLSLKTKNK